MNLELQEYMEIKELQEPTITKPNNLKGAGRPKGKSNLKPRYKLLYFNMTDKQFIEIECFITFNNLAEYLNNLFKTDEYNKQNVERIYNGKTKNNFIKIIHI